MTIPAGVDLTSLVTVLATAFVAGLARGFSGFGAALIFVPLASAAIGPRLAVPLLLIIDFVTTISLIPNAWRIANRGEVAIMSVGALVGVPLGAYVLNQADPSILRWAIAGLVIVLLALLVSGWRYQGQPSLPLTVGIGGLAGFCSGSAQMGGPPVVAYWLGGAVAHHAVRANIILYFAISSIFSVVSYLAGGLLVGELLWLSVLTAPLFGAGLYFGSKLFGWADAIVFRRICYSLIAMAALLGLPVWDSI